jgi:hypothetical protein
MADNADLQSATLATLPAGTKIAFRTVTYSGDAGAAIAPVSLITLTGADDAKTATDVDSSNPLPVTASALPLPTGAATSALQGTGNTSLSNIDGKLPALVTGRVPVDPSGVTSPVSAASLPLPTGASTLAEQSTQTTALVAIQTAVQVLDNIVAGSEAQVDVVTVPADPFGANADAAVAAGAAGSIQAKLRLMTSQLDAIQTAVQVLDNIVSGSEAQVDVVTLPNVTLAAGTNTNEVVGDAAHGASVSGNPVLVGLEGRSTEGTAVTSGQVVRAAATLLGRQAVELYGLPGNSWNYAAASGGIVNTTAVTVKAAAGAGIRSYITSFQVLNGHATVSTEFLIRDGASGTVIWRGYLLAAGGGYSVELPRPLRSSANTLLEVVCVTTGAAVYFNCQGYTSAE